MPFGQSLIVIEMNPLALCVFHGDDDGKCAQIGKEVGEHVKESSANTVGAMVAGGDGD